MNTKITATLMLMGAATFGSLGGPNAYGAASIMKGPAALELVIAESHEALRKILNGDPSGYAALFAD